MDRSGADGACRLPPIFCKTVNFEKILKNFSIAIAFFNYCDTIYVGVSKGIPFCRYTNNGGMIKWLTKFPTIASLAALVLMLVL